MINLEFKPVLAEVTALPESCNTVANNADSHVEI